MWKPRCIHWHHIKKYSNFYQKRRYVINRLRGWPTPSSDMMGCKHTGGTFNEKFARSMEEGKVQAERCIKEWEKVHNTDYTPEKLVILGPPYCGIFGFE